MLMNLDRFHRWYVPQFTEFLLHSDVLPKMGHSLHQGARVFTLSKVATYVTKQVLSLMITVKQMSPSLPTDPVRRLSEEFVSLLSRLSLSGLS